MYALVSAVYEMLHLKKLVLDFSVTVNIPIMFEDNEGAIKLLKNYRNNVRCKHLQVRVDFVLDVLERKEFEVKYVKSKNQLADVFTKSFPSIIFEEFIPKLNLIK